MIISIFRGGNGLEAIMKYCKFKGLDASKTLETTVTALDAAGDVILSDIFKVIFSNKGNYFNISIMWEEYGYENYKDLGLYGFYGSSYLYELEFNGNNLTFENNEGVKIIIQ